MRGDNSFTTLLLPACNQRISQRSLAHVEEITMSRVRAVLFTTFTVAGVLAGLLLQHSMSVSASDYHNRDRAADFHALEMLDRGRTTFRYDTYGDERFWGGALHIHKSIEVQQLGGVGLGVEPETALAVGLQVDGAAVRG